MKTVECSVFVTNCWYTFWNANRIEKPRNFWTKISNFVQFNHKNYCCNLSLNIMTKRWKYSVANTLNCSAIFFCNSGSSGKNSWEVFNFRELVDCFNKEKSENVVEKAISRQYVKKKYFSHIVDKRVSIRRNSLEALIIMSSFLLLFLLLFLLIVFISLAFHL